MSRSTRHTVILVIVTLSGCLAAFGGWRFAKASAPVNGPIVVVSIDALRADHVGAYGYTQARTPAIDRLAADGILFERAYAHVPQTLPAHVALLTGRLPFESGVRDGAGFRVPDTARTLAELLRDRGYATGGIVSSFLLRKETGIGRGFTFFDAELTPPGSSLDAGSVLIRDGAESEQVAEHWLDSAGTSRALLFLHLADTLAPYTPRERFSELSPYDAAVAYADETVGRLVRYLKAHQLYDRATIVLVADHGEGLGDTGELGHGVLVDDEVLRVPLIIKPPAGDSTVRRVALPVQHADIVPTILDLAKAPGGSGLRGRSLVPLFSGDPIPDADLYAESLFGYYRFGWPEVRAVVRDHYLLVESGTNSELFDLSEPGGDRTDVADERPTVVADMQARLARFNSAAPPAAPGPVAPGDRDRFDALGYVGVPAVHDTPSPDVTDSATQLQFVEQVRRAARLNHSGQWQQALDGYRALTRAYPDVADLWLHLAQTAARNERQEPAIEAFRRALTLEPRNTAAYLGAAASSFRARRLDDAAQYAQAVLDAGSTDPVQQAEAHELLARVAVNRRDITLARAEAAAAEAADPDRPVQAFVAGRVALDQGRYEDAVTSFEEALNVAARTSRAPLTDLRVLAAEALARVNRPRDAERLLTAELDAFPANARARVALQTLYRQTGRPQDATALAQH